MKILLIAYDNGSYIHWFPQGLAYIAAVLKKSGHSINIYNQDKFHFSEEHLTGFLNKNKFDVIALGVVAGYYQYRKLLKISDAINKSKNRPFYIIGGHGPSPEPEFFMEKTLVDVVVIGEGENTIIEVLKNVENNNNFSHIEGIAYWQGNEVKINKKRDLIKDINSIPLPAYELFPMEYYRLLRAPYSTNEDFVMPVISGRGCPFCCTFCYRMEEGIRARSNEGIVDEINYLKNKYLINYIIFSDELLMSSINRTISLCEALLRNGLKVKWCCNGRLNFARAKVLRLMKKSGCVFINYGVESMDNNVLKNMKKNLTAEIAIEGIEETLKAGISPGINMIFGNIGDNKKTLSKAVKFLLKYDDCSQLRTIRPVTPYPGSRLYYYAIEKGLLKNCEDFYENKHINSDLLSVNFTSLSSEEFHGCLLKANTTLLKNHFFKKSNEKINAAEKLYLERDFTFRGFRQT